MACKTYSGKFMEKVSEILVECNVGKGYDCLCKEALSFFKYENFH